MHAGYRPVQGAVRRVARGPRGRGRRAHRPQRRRQDHRGPSGLRARRADRRAGCSSTARTSPASRPTTSPGRHRARTRGTVGVRHADGRGEPARSGSGAGSAGRASAPRSSKAYELFPRLGERRRQGAGSLSGGEQRMLTLAAVLVLEPKLLIADELSLGLAPIITDDLYDVLERILAVGHRAAARRAARRPRPRAGQRGDRARARHRQPPRAPEPGRDPHLGVRHARSRVMTTSHRRCPTRCRWRCTGAVGDVVIEARSVPAPGPGRCSPRSATAGCAAPTST